MKNFLIIIVIFSIQLNGQNTNFYKDLNANGLKIYSQINKDPVIINHGNIISENTLPSYAKGLQFMQAPGLFSSVNGLYTYLTNNPLFFFNNYTEGGSYYNKNSTHIAQRTQYYYDGLYVLNKSLSLSTDGEAKETGIWDLISNVRYQLVYRETYIKNNNYEFLLLSTINVYKADINPYSSSDIQMAAKYFLRDSTPEEIERLKKSSGSFCLVKEDGLWKACSAEVVFEYLNNTGSLALVTQKVNSTNFYDVLSTVVNGTRQYLQVN